MVRLIECLMVSRLKVMQCDQANTDDVPQGISVINEQLERREVLASA